MIPTINISAWLSPTSTSQSRNAVVDEIRSACRAYGFFQLEGHGIPLEMQNEVLQCAERFFSLPLEQKKEVSIKKSVGSANRGYEDFQGQRLESKALPDLKEGFFIGEEIPVDSPRAGKFLQGPNQWPATLPREKFRDPLLEYRRRMVELAELVLRLLGLALPEEHSSAAFFDDFMIHPSGNLRLLHYPPQTSTDEMQLGAGAHTDFGGLTLLLQKPATSGLQVWYPPTATWIPVPVRENAFVVNIGDLLQLWTGGYYRSALHRVINRGENHRYSAPFFYNGNGDLVFEPIGDESGCKTTVSEHIRGKLLTSLGKSDKDAMPVV